MKLVNKTTNKIITYNLKNTSNWIEASFGLLSQPKGTAMMFHTRWGIHTFGMQYPIDILILDKRMKVIFIKKNLRPNQIFFWNPKYSTIIELPHSKSAIKPGDLLKLK